MTLMPVIIYPTDQELATIVNQPKKDKPESSDENYEEEPQKKISLNNALAAASTLLAYLEHGKFVDQQTS